MPHNVPADLAVCQAPTLAMLCMKLSGQEQPSGTPESALNGHRQAVHSWKTYLEALAFALASLSNLLDGPRVDSAHGRLLRFHFLLRQHRRRPAQGVQSRSQKGGFAQIVVVDPSPRPTPSEGSTGGGLPAWGHPCLRGFDTLLYLHLSAN